MRLSRLCRFLFGLGAGLMAALPYAGAAKAPAEPYKGYVVMDAGTGDILISSNPDEISPPASMTKLMTYAVLVDQLKSGELSLQSRAKVTAEDAKIGMIRDSTAVWLRTNEVFTIDELIYAMMIQSANDAAYMVGRVVGGTVPHFIEMMNAKARALGMAHSTFRTPNGFPVKSRRVSEGDLTSPRDFALLCRYLISHTDILRYTSVKTRPFGAQVRFPPTIMTNHNHLIGTVAGVDGLKTGFTNGAGFCLATTAQRGSRRLIVVVMDSPDSKTRDRTVVELLDRGFSMPVVQHPKLVPAPAPAVPAASGSGGGPGIKFSVPGSGR
jgi:D-alanyl-D-alanine carboxypeptidase (penicillin-binding protein 5/6)